MRAAPFVMFRAALAFAFGVALLILVAGSSTAQNAPASMNVLVEQVLSLFPKVDSDVLEVAGDVVTLSAGRRDGVVPGIRLSGYRGGREVPHPRAGAMLCRTGQGVGRVVVGHVQGGYATRRLTEGDYCLA